MNNPEYVEIENVRYKINTDFRVALKCQEVALDDTIGNYERSLAIIYLLFGDKGLNASNHYEKLLNLSIKYLSCGEKQEETSNEEPDFDFQQDYRLIQASFKSDYGINLDKEKIHYWDFYMYLNGLTDKCVLNRIRELRTYDTSQIKDIKEKNKIEKMKKRFALKKKSIPLTDKQQESVEIFYKLTGIKRKE